MSAFDLVEHVRTLPPERGALVRGERLVVGLSGGADSVALLDVALRLGLDVVAAHLDHALRPDAADDARFCQDLCAARGVPCVIERTDVGARAAASGAGVEAAGRAARYEFFDRVLAEHQAHRIATAHHLDDHVESVLLALGRGTGLRGLRGIAAVRGRLVRPFRDVRRQFLRAHLSAHGVPWREDPSNRDPERRRNRMREVVIPAFEEIFDAGALRRIGSTGERAAEDLALLDELVESRLEALRHPTGDGTLALDREGFLDASKPLRSALLRAAARRLFTDPSHQKWNADHVANVLSFIERAHAGQRWSLPGRGRLAVERDRLILSTDLDEEGGVGVGTLRAGSVGAQLTSELLPASGQGCSFSGPLHAVVDAARVRPPFVLRPLLPGDRIQPHGMEGHKKVATLSSERGVPREQRADQLVVCDRDRIVWAVGLTTCHRARIDESTRRVWQLRIEPADDVPSGQVDA